jgi:hypothetical protein
MTSCTGERKREPPDRDRTGALGVKQEIETGSKSTVSLAQCYVGVADRQHALILAGRRISDNECR